VLREYSHCVLCAVLRLPADSAPVNKNDETRPTSRCYRVLRAKRLCSQKSVRSTSTAETCATSATLVVCHNSYNRTRSAKCLSSGIRVIQLECELLQRRWAP